VQRGPLREHGSELTWIEPGQLGRGRLMPKPYGQLVRGAERLLQRDLLVQHHRQQQRERVVGQQRVGRWRDRQG
jgi:hypothetical protein